MHRPAPAVPCQSGPVLLVPPPPSGENERVNARFPPPPHHCPQLLVRQRLTPHEQQIADVVLRRDGNDILRLLERYATALLGIETVHSESAEIAFRVANIGDGELQVTRSAVVKHFPQQLPRAVAGLRTRCAYVCWVYGRGRAFRAVRTSQGRGAHH